MFFNKSIKGGKRIQVERYIDTSLAKNIEVKNCLKHKPFRVIKGIRENGSNHQGKR